MKVLIPTSLPSYTDDRREVHARGRSLSDLLADLDRQFPGFHLRMVDEQGRTRLPAFLPVFERMAAYNWLTAYRDPDNVARALDRMAAFRLRRPNALAGSGRELLQAYAGFEADFLPDALAFAESVRRSRVAN